MLPDIGVPMETLAPTVVALFIAGRIYFGEEIFDVKYAPIWGLFRRILWPIMNTIAKRRFGVEIPNYSPEEEYVATSPQGWYKVATLLSQCRRFEVSVLSGWNTDWEDREEVGSIVAYHGPKPFPGAPKWLRARQLHIRFFETEEGDTVIAAHEEANSYRMDKWRDHLFAQTMDREKGVRMTKSLLEENDEIELYD